MDNIYQKAIDGQISASLAYAELLGQQEEINEKIEALKPMVLSELQLHPEKEVKMHGLTFQKKMTPARWDYSEVSQWKSLKEKMKTIEELAKQVFKANEKFQQVNIVDDNGEIISSAKYTAGTETFAVLKK